MSRRYGLILAGLFLLAGCGRKAGEGTVVVYSSVDDVFARPVAQRFQAFPTLRIDALEPISGARSA